MLTPIKYFNVIKKNFFKYKATDFVIPEAGTLEIRFKPKNPNSKLINHIVNEFNSAGVSLSMYNTDSSIQDFAHSCFNYALERKYPLYLRLFYLNF